MLSKRRYMASVTSSLLALLALAACSQQSATGPQSVNGMLPSGTIEMHQVQAAYIASAGGGSGTLFFEGEAYPFRVGGLGIGGIGASTITAAGDVYGLTQLSQFSGAYVQGRYGFAFGTKSGGDLWLKNNNGVILHLNAKREGLMLSLGGDAVVISLK
jgi:hypothetical protein